MVTNYVGDGRITKYGVRFTGQVWPGDTLNATATVDDVSDGIVTLSVETTNQDGVVVLSGLRQRPGGQATADSVGTAVGLASGGLPLFFGRANVQLERPGLGRLSI